MEAKRVVGLSAKIVFRALAIVCCLAFSSVAWAQDYRLHPGDTLRAEIIRINSTSWTSVIDAAGFVRFPFIGRHLAAGKTLEELQEDIALAVVGSRVSVQNGSVETFIVLDETSVFIEVAEYRPIIVLGAVGAPGRIDYRPGMTVRAALGIAGGIGLAHETDTRPERVAQLTARIAELEKTEAWQRLDLWRILGQLDATVAEAPPAEFASLIETRLGADVIDNVRQQIAEAQRDRDLEVEELQARIDLTESRISYLMRALEQYEIVSKGEEERLATLLTLQDRGLAVNESVNDARSGALSVSSRLLQAEADLSETRRDLTSLTQQFEAVDLNLRQDLLAEQARVQRALDENAARLQGARQELAVLTGMLVDDEAGSPVQPSILLHRQENGSVTSLAAGLNHVVRPGDVLEVLMISETSSQ